MSVLANKALEIAITQIGQDEKPHGSNWGEPVKTYLANVGIDFPASWCMAFVYTCFKEAAAVLNAPNTAIKTGGVLNAWSRAVPAQKSNKPAIGSVFIMDFGGGLGHTGIVKSFDETFIYTIDGNSNDTGSREGVAVTPKRRARKSIKGYLNF